MKLTISMLWQCAFVTAVTVGPGSGGIDAAQGSLPGATGRPLQRLGQHGRWLTDPQGRVVILHGGNVIMGL